MSKLISVITLSYNNLQFYEECLSSIISQDYDSVEWILCDDGSGNYSEYEEKIKDYLDSQTHHLQNMILYHSPRNKGIIANYKEALDRAKGEYIFYLAIDDAFYDTSVLSDVSRYFEETGCEIMGGYWEISLKTGQTHRYPSEAEVDLLKNASLEVIYRRFIRRTILIGACVPFRKSLVDRLGFFDHPQLQGYVHLEDRPRYLYLMEHGVRFGFLPRMLIKYRTSGITSEIKNKDLINDYKKLMGRYFSPPFSEIMQVIRKKKFMVAWGSSGGFLTYFKQWEDAMGKKFDWIIDSNADKWGKILEGKEIRSPKMLMDYPAEEIFVMVCSQSYYVEIAKELEDMGLVEGKNFEVLSQEIIIWIG